jgi:NADPH-dependent F420 reductase
MRIAILGGTGDIGQGLALRWGLCSDHELLIGSRDPEKARTKAEEYETELDSRGVETSIKGFENAMAADRARVVVLAVPAYHAGDTVEAVQDGLEEDDVLVTPAVGMTREDEGFRYHPPSAGSVTELVAAAAPSAVSVIGAYHNLAANRLATLDVGLGIDTLLIGDDEDAKDLVRALTEEIDGLRPLDAGGLANAPEIESLTPLLINVAQNNEGLHDLGVSFS